MVSGTIWLETNKDVHLIQDDHAKYLKDAWGIKWFKYLPTGREVSGHYEYMYVGEVYS